MAPDLAGLVPLARDPDRGPTVSALEENKKIIDALPEADRRRLYDRWGKFSILDSELEHPIRFGTMLGRKCLILGPPAGSCEACRAASRTMPGCEPTTPEAQAMHDLMDVSFIGMRHSQRCERRIMLATDGEFLSEEEKEKKAIDIVKGIL